MWISDYSSLINKGKNGTIRYSREEVLAYEKTLLISTN
jgi:hypothetical protein